MKNINIYKVFAFLGHKEVTKEILEQELLKIEKNEGEVYQIYNYINMLTKSFPILDKLDFSEQYDIIQYYNDGKESHQGFSRKRKGVSKKDFNKMIEVLKFIKEDQSRLYYFMLLYVGLYLLD